METVTHQLEDQGVHSYILDLRNNPGGLVKSGLDVSHIWLDGDETLVNTIDRNGNMFPINTVSEHAITHDPLVVLLVTELHDGSALFVTVAKYLSTALHEIDKVGITPDVQCTADIPNSQKPLSLKSKNGNRSSTLEVDSCIMVAEHELDIQDLKGIAS